jgi:hypothetical protein
VQRIAVTGAGIVVMRVSEPLMSVFGTVMRPGAIDVHDLPWDEIFRVTFGGGIVIDLTWGECLEIPGTADGFEAAVRELCRLSGAAATDGAPIWPAP